jgi:hypothetical protein
LKGKREAASDNSERSTIGVTMAQEQDHRINARPLEDTIVGIGPGIPDDALAPGQELPTPPSEEEMAAIARKLDVSVPGSGDPT